MRTVVLIPARYASSRYPGKPLVELMGKPMILWVAELACKAVDKADVFVATDDKRIASVVESAGFGVVMTSSACLTGTDRLAEAAAQIAADIFINVQGDEPLASADDILKIINYKQQHMDVVVNGFSKISESEDPNSVNIPKVITTEDNKLVYMSRAALPAYKEAKNAPKEYKKQVCIYAFTQNELQQFADLGRKSALEASEDIEILRFLELGIDVHMVETQPGSLAVDVPEDVAKVEAAMRAQELIE